MARLVILPKARSRTCRSASVIVLCASSAPSLRQRARRSGFERAGFDRRPHGAAGLALVPAVAEAAFGGQRDDVGEHLVDAGLHIGELQFAHARRVDQPAAGRQPMQRAAGGGVAALVVILANALRGDADPFRSAC